MALIVRTSGVITMQSASGKLGGTDSWFQNVINRDNVTALTDSGWTVVGSTDMECYLIHT